MPAKGEIILSVEDLHIKIGSRKILNGVSLDVRAGEVHAIMGPNGSGKSTLASVLAGRDYIKITHGKVTFEGNDLLELAPEDRAREGIFLGFQYPVEIPGVSMVNFLRTALNEHKKYKGEKPLSAGDFLKLMREKNMNIHVVQNGVHGSSMLNRKRVYGDVEPNWKIVFEFLDSLSDKKTMN